MFGLPDWLVNLIFTLVVQWGIPIAQKLLPSIPPEVWAAVQEALSHFHKTQGSPATAEDATALRNAVNSFTRV